MNKKQYLIITIMSFLTLGCIGQEENSDSKTASLKEFGLDLSQSKRASMIAALFKIEKYIFNDYELLLQNHRVLNATSREMDIADPTNPIIVNGTIRDEGNAIRLIDCETGTITVGPTVRIDERGSGIYSGVADFMDFYGVSTKHEYGEISDCPKSSIPITGGKYYHGKIRYESTKNGDVKGVLGIYPNGRKPQPFYFEVSFGRIKAIYGDINLKHIGNNFSPYRIKSSFLAMYIASEDMNSKELYNRNNFSSNNDMLFFNDYDMLRDDNDSFKGAYNRVYKTIDTSDISSVFDKDKEFIDVALDLANINIVYSNAGTSKKKAIGSLEYAITFHGVNGAKDETLYGHIKYSGKTKDIYTTKGGIDKLEIKEVRVRF